ncbi:MAG: hypothetical protein JRE40_00070 [Deltaproteobacteria bacterium]|nr:hypothetical protein [Deltaproteobacteria bacterium]
MASKRAIAIRREMLARKQLSFNDQMGILLLAIAEKVGVDFDELLEAGLDPEPAELAEVTEPPQAKEAPKKKKAPRKKRAKKVEPPIELEHDPSKEDDGTTPSDPEEGLGW